MKITFSNLGAIKKTTLDLRPLTVIIGPNNSNKTYIAYSIYGLWQYVRENFFQYVFRELEFKVENPNTLSLDINDNFYALFDKVYKENSKGFVVELETFFQDTSRKLFNQTSYAFDISKEEIKKTFKDAINSQRQIMALTDNYDYKLKKDTLFITINRKKTRDSNEKFSSSNIQVSYNLSFKIVNSLFPQPFLLPAERNAFVITYKMLANRRYKFLRQTQRNLSIGRAEIRPTQQKQLELLKEQGDIRYPQPIEDFLDFLTDVELETNIDKELRETDKFFQIADEIEKKIQNNNKTNFKPTKLGGNEIKINIKKGVDIDLYNASSSIKQLAPLLIYLRFRAKDGDLLIIDEPEMNLHPESQAKLLEVLGMLVNAGVNVLLTTHSPYFMSHLNNLIAGDMTDEKSREKQAKWLYLGDKRAFLKPEDVSAYEMRQNKTGDQTLHDLHDKDYGIRWDTLSDVSADIQQKFFEIYEQKEKSSNGEGEK